MPLASSTLRPGLLVVLKTSVRGNVSYRTNAIEAPHTTADGAVVEAWETEKTVADPAEHEKAIQARSKARGIITSVCAKSAFGLLCPEANAAILEAAIKDARYVTDAFNERAGLSRVELYVITGKVAQDDVEAIRAINSEVRDLVAEMEEGIKNLDVKVVRDAADKARQIGTMLAPEAQAKVADAIEAARTIARKIKKAGETASAEIDQTTLAKLASARTAFLDIDDVQQQVAAPQAVAHEVDFAPAAPIAPAKVANLEIDF